MPFCITIFAGRTTAANAFQPMGCIEKGDSCTAKNNGNVQIVGPKGDEKKEDAKEGKKRKEQSGEAMLGKRDERDNAENGKETDKAEKKSSKKHSDLQSSDRGMSGL